MMHRLILPLDLPRRLRAGLCAACLAAAPCGGRALAQGASSQGLPGSSTQQNPTPGAGGAAQGAAASPGEPGFTTQLFASSRSNLLGDLWGVRPKLARYGISLGLQETSEVFGNVTGGIHRGAAYNGLTELSLGLDTGRAFGWPGGTFNVSALQIHGRNLSSDDLGSLQTASGIEAQRATRLWELWYQQALLDGLDVKLGQQSLDQEFIDSAGSGLFINTAMGWPLVPSVDQYAGGPAYPLSSLGVRLRAQPIGNLTILAGVFDDDPPGGSFGDDSQVRGPEQSGAAFHLGTGALAIAEIQYAINQPSVGQMDDGRGGSGGLPGVYKLGAWFDSGGFPDQRFDVDGLSLANPDSNGDPKLRRDDWSIYGVFDQVLWRPAADGPRAVGIFARIMGAPDDRNLASFGINSGITLKAPLPGRDNDSLGIGYGLAKIGDRASALDADQAQFGHPVPVRSGESFIEVTYQAQLAPWLSLQPDFQYVFTPSGGIQDPNDRARRIGNEAVFGLRTGVTF